MRLALDIFSVVSRHVDYLGQRYSVAAENVAHSDSPGFRAKQIGDFQQALTDAGGLELAKTSSSHLNGSTDPSGDYEVSFQNNQDVSHSGNDVVLEKEMATIGDTSRQMSFDTGIARMFQHMYLMSVKS